MSLKLLNPESRGEEHGEGSSSFVQLLAKQWVRFNWEDRKLFLCSRECYWDISNYRPDPARYQPWDSSYVVRSINLSDFLTSPNVGSWGLARLARLDDRDLAGEVGCGVLGSKIVFASGMKPNFGSDRFGPPFGPDPSTDAYAFDIHRPNQGIVKMPGALNGGKYSPLMVEYAGKLYVLSYKHDERLSFEVFDPKQGTWSLLPSYPDAGLCYPLSTASYTVAGTKLYMSTSLVDPTDDAKICCFDFAAGEWERVPNLCQGGCLPFAGQAVALDMPQPEHSNKKLLFSASRGYSGRASIRVHLMSLDENHEDIIDLIEMDLPAELPCQPYPNDCHFFHLGGNTFLLVSTSLGDDAIESGTSLGEDAIEYGKCIVSGITFKFQFDISKVDTDRKNCFSIHFQPFLQSVRFRSSGDCMSPPTLLGCFLL